MPKLSVIIPVYGVEKYIERCARSLFEQTLDDIEYLFIDDCTPDNSIEILKQVIEKYPQRKPQVIIHRMDKNSGQAAVRGWGLQNARGDYLIQCDSDDWVDGDMYRVMYEKAMKENADVVICDFLVTDGKTNKTVVKGCHDPYVPMFFKNLIMQKDSWSLCNKLFKRSICSKDIVIPRGDMGEDMVFVVQFLYYCKSLVYIPKPYYIYFENHNSITRVKTDNIVIRNCLQCASNVSSLDSFFKKIKTKRVSKKDIRNLFYFNYNAHFPLGINKIGLAFRSLFKILSDSNISSTGKFCVVVFIINRILLSIKKLILSHFCI